jgi:N-acylneuraminate cytidylyltransferase
MNYKIIIPARLNSRRLPGKNMRILGDKPLIQHSIDFAINYFGKDITWVNSDDKDILQFAEKMGVNVFARPPELGKDQTTTVDVLINQVKYFKENNIDCDAIILFQPTNPFRDNKLLKYGIEKFQTSGRNSLATFSKSEKKMGKIENDNYVPINYVPGQRSQDIEKSYYENGLFYITKCESILAGKVITEDVYPLVCENLESTIDIDYLEDFLLAESILKIKKYE